MVCPIRVQGTREADEVAGNQPGPLVNQLIIGVLTVGPGLAPDDWSGLIINNRPLQSHTFAIALHVELLAIGAEPPQVLIIGEDGMGFSVKKVDVPHTEKTEKHRKVLLERRGLEMLIHRTKSGEQVTEMIRPDRDHQRKPDSRI